MGLSLKKVLSGWAVISLICLSYSVESLALLSSSQGSCQISFFSLVPNLLSLDQHDGRGDLWGGEFFGVALKTPGLNLKNHWRLYLKFHKETPEVGEYTSNFPFLKKIQVTQSALFKVEEYRGHFVSLSGKEQYVMIATVEYRNQNGRAIGMADWVPQFSQLEVAIQYPGSNKKTLIHRLQGKNALQSIRNLKAL